MGGDEKPTKINGRGPEGRDAGSCHSPSSMPFVFVFTPHQLLYVGWRGNKRDFGCILHLDIKQGKIWIQHDGTEIGIANQLVEMGVPKQDIVLAFHEPEIRQFTDFGTGEAIAVG